MSFYIILLCVIIYIYLFLSNEVPKKVINIYKNPVFKVIFLMTLYFFGYYNIYLTLFLAINYVVLDLKIKNQELLENFSS